MNAEQQAILDAEFVTGAYEGLTTQQIADALTARPELPNPEPAPEVLLPFTAAEVHTEAGVAMDAVSDAAKIELIRIEEAQGHSSLASWSDKFLPAEVATKVKDKLASRKGADPNWPATVAGDTRLEELGLGGYVAFGDIEAGRA